MFSQHIVTAQKKLGSTNGSALLQAAGSCPKSGKSQLRPFVPYNQSVYSRQENTGMTQSVDVLARNQDQEEIASLRYQLGAQQEEIDGLRKQLDQLRADVDRLKQQPVQAPVKAAPAALPPKPAPEDLPNEQRDIPNMVVRTPEVNHPQSPDFPQSKLIVQANAAFGSSVARQLRLLGSSSPSNDCYNCFYGVGSRVQALMETPKFYAFCRDTFGELREYNGSRAAIEECKAVLRSRFNLSLALIVVRYCLEQLPDINLGFMDKFQAQEKFKTCFATCFGESACDQTVTVRENKYEVLRPVVAYTMLSVVISLMDCKIVRYEKIVGTLREFAQLYGAHMAQGSDGEQEAYVLLPQWQKDNNKVCIPAYVRLHK